MGRTGIEVPDTAPTLGLILRLVAPFTLQDNVLEPPARIDVGLAVKLLIVGGALAAVTVTVALAVADPLLFFAVSVYVVVAVGLTETEVPDTAPTFALILRLVAPFTLQDNVLEPPARIDVGLAVKLLIVGGALAAVTVTVALAVADPLLFLAVSVYVVVAAGLTGTEVPDTAPTLGLILRLAAPLTLQDNVLEPPVMIVEGVALKLAIAGTPEDSTVMKPSIGAAACTLAPLGALKMIWPSGTV